MALPIAHSFEEAVALGHRVAEEKKTLYSPLMLEKMLAIINAHIPDAAEARKQDILYASVYDFNAYGARVHEEFAYRLFEKTHEEKAQYLVSRLRRIYVDHLCGGYSDEIMHRIEHDLENKWTLYRRLEPYYKREIVHIVSEDSFPDFAGFVSRHPDYIVKPLEMAYADGVHLASVRDFPSPEEAFRALLEEAARNGRRHPSFLPELVLEELIEQDEAMAVLHPQSVNVLRITTVRAASGEMVLYRPRIKIGINGNFIASGAKNGILAEIDPVTGIICTDGFNENREFFVTHPNTGVVIKGFQIPRWDELLALVDDLNRELPEYGYVGWDIVLSKSGWCVIEGNYSGEIMSQIIRGGLRREFEALIGWKPEREYWELYD